MEVLVNDPGDPERLLLRSGRTRDRLLVRFSAGALDRRLARGDVPESNVLLALRAQILARPDTRRALARNWEHLVRVARGQPVRGAPLRRAAIVAAESAIAEMLQALATEHPTPARGVAMAGVLLRDGAGPLYNGQSTADLATAVRDATAQLDPTTSVAPRA
ncbi:MAG TPA: hypothetical protein VN799_05685 [Acidimicrobiales bacterium]|nr:hypothetical protein [Acidimicrobiales bacterium]